MIEFEPIRNQSDIILNDMGYDMYAEYRRAVILANFDKKRDVLDVGTGSGRMLSVLVSTGHSVISGDIDPDASERAKQRIGEHQFERLTMIHMDATQIPYDDGSFNSIVCANALHEMRCPRRALAEMARVCAPDGKLLIIEFTELGFDVISKSHRIQHQKDHSRGLISKAEIQSELLLRFETVDMHDLDLNHVWISRNKMDLMTNC
jgi:ubiquinone/menaquinone biosynthesis C-methylase UbiE